MKKDNATLWLPLVLLFAVGVLAFVLPAWVDATVRLGKLTGITDAWAGFAGSIIAAAISLVAALIAYLAVTQQIRSAERIAVRREEEMLDVLKSDLANVLALIDYVWKTVDWSLRSDITNDRRHFRVFNATTNLLLLPNADQVDAFRARASALLPLQAASFAPVVHWLDTCNGVRNALERGPVYGETDIAFHTRIASTAQTSFTGLARAVEAFDPPLSRIFDKRMRSDRFALPAINQLHATFDLHVAQEIQIFGTHADTASRQP